MFSNLFVSNGRQWYKSTCPYEDNTSRSFNQVHILRYESCLLKHDEFYMETMHYRQSNAKKPTLRARFKNLFSFSSSQKNKSYSLSDDLTSLDENTKVPEMQKRSKISI